jgi:hypothetical protein
MYFNEFFYVFYSDSGEIYTDVRRRSLNIRQFSAEGFVRGLIVDVVFNRSSHPMGYSRVLL